MDARCMQDRFDIGSSTKLSRKGRDSYISTWKYWSGVRLGDAAERPGLYNLARLLLVYPSTNSLVIKKCTWARNDQSLRGFGMDGRFNGFRIIATSCCESNILRLPMLCPCLLCFCTYHSQLHVAIGLSRRADIPECTQHWCRPGATWFVWIPFLLCCYGCLWSLTRHPHHRSVRHHRLRHHLTHLNCYRAIAHLWLTNSSIRGQTSSLLRHSCLAMKDTDLQIP